MFYGLTMTDVRQLAYEFARKMEIRFPSSWNAPKRAGVEWFVGFMKRHKNLSLRKPQATSIARAMCFNQANVSAFYRNLATVMDEHHFTAHNIYNMDETSISTVHHPARVVAEKGSNQVAKMSSADRGATSTIALAVSAAGVVVPPFFIFPRVRLPARYLDGAPDDSMAIANDSGWQNGKSYFMFLQQLSKLRQSH